MAIPDPSKVFFEPFFGPFQVYGGIPFLARRLYAYSNVIQNVAQFENPIYMENAISAIWSAKNPITDPSFSTR